MTRSEAYASDAYTAVPKPMIGAKDLGWIQRKNWQRRAAFLKSADGELVARARRSTHRQKGARPPIRFLSSASPRTRLSCVRGGSHRETREEHEINQKSQKRSKRRRNGKEGREENLVEVEKERGSNARERDGKEVRHAGRYIRVLYKYVHRRV